jgi:uncharacterized RDD family membrane protein YckC
VTPSGSDPAPGAGNPTHYLMGPGARALSASVVFAVCAAYCVGLWSGGRRTLPMQTWRLALRTREGLPVTPARAWLRFLACGVGPACALAGYGILQPAGNGRWAIALLALNYAWAFCDRDRDFLQDRIAGTRLVLATGTPARS